MTVPADGLCGPSCCLMGIEVKANEVFGVHDDCSVMNGGQRAFAAVSTLITDQFRSGKQR